MIIQAKLFTSNYINRVGHVFTAFLSNIVTYVKTNLYFMFLMYTLVAKAVAT